MLGWWKYDDRTNKELEEAHKQNINVVEILICGELYVIDLVQKLQFPKKHSSRKRYIKRDLNTTVSKGVAGLPKY